MRLDTVSRVTRPHGRVGWTVEKPQAATTEFKKGVFILSANFCAPHKICRFEDFQNDKIKFITSPIGWRLGGRFNMIKIDLEI